MDSDAGALCATIVLVILILVDFIMVAFENALSSVTESEIEDFFQKDAKPKELLLNLKDSSRKLRHTVWLLNALTCAAAGYLIKGPAGHLPFYGVVPVLVLVFYLFGNSLPEVAGKKDPMQVLKRRCRSVSRIMMVLSPFTYFLTAISHLLVRLLGIDPKSLEQEVTEDEIISMVNEGHEQGVLDAREAEMIQNIFELDDKNAGNIMTHRKNIIGINGCMNLRDGIAFMVGESVSRFPVYEENIDNILGILHFKDAMKFHTMGSYDDWLIKDIPELLRSVRFIPETRGINDLFRTMQAEKLQMVMVVDEYGQTAGLVAMEDILEEIVGNIQDEYDNEVPLIREEPDGAYLMDGMAPLTEVSDVLDISLEEEEYDTLNGLLISRLDRIPSDGEKAQVKEWGYLFQILEVEDKMIRLVKITKSNEEEKE